MRRAVFLDRDGVLTRSEVRGGKPYAPRRLDDFQLLPGAVESLNELRNAGWLLIVVTNQPDVANGALDPQVLDAMHARLHEWLPLDEICACCHSDADACACRKPKPGLLLEAAGRWEIEMSESFLIGDRWRDVSAGKAAGCKTIFIDHGYSEELRDAPDVIVKSITDAARVILDSSALPVY